MAACYISCGCNCLSHCVDWGTNGLICYGTCNAVAIYDPQESGVGKVIETLHHHKDRVNSVQWIKSRNGTAETELLSCSVDGTANIWSKTKDSFTCTSVLNGDDILITCSSLYLDNNNNSITENSNNLLVCIGSIAGNLQSWVRSKSGDIKCLETLTFEKKLFLTCCLSYLSNSKVLLLAVAMEDSSVQLFSHGPVVTNEMHFTKLQILTGHEDWVKCIDFTYDNQGNVLLATGSQDATIRLWKISKVSELSVKDELYQKKQTFEVDHIKYDIELESILSGHENWIYGVQWSPKQNNEINNEPVKLLSCSLDKSMIIWESNLTTGIWTETVRVGEVGGNSSGFYGCKFSPNGLGILAHGYQGSFHIWQYLHSTKNWVPRPMPSGHFGEVCDLSWEPKGRFLISVSTDQTTRIHAPWENNSKVWHEIGRPQVHGYDMACLAILTPYMFASGAEEKVVRVFTAPSSFKKHLTKIANVDDFDHVIIENATVPALGLTNKANFDIKEEEKGKQIDRNMEYDVLTEEHLLQDTLWPELQKLYGHGYEIFSMAANHDGSLLATACKSTTFEHSAIILWSTETWMIIQRLVSHQLTVTQIAFSPNNKYLLSVSRDRRWSLFEYDGHLYNLIAFSSKQNNFHTRIIWCCAWTHDSQYFATGSRDGKIGVWNIENIKNVIPETSLIQKQSVTSLAFAPLKIMENTYILAIGYEIGHIEIKKLVLTTEKCTWEKYITFDSSQAHHLTVKRLTFQPNKKDQCTNLQLASCGSDHAIKIYDINILESKKL